MHFYVINVIKEVLDDDLGLYDFCYKFNYFKANIFKTWIKVGNEFDNDSRINLSDITYCIRAIYHYKKRDEECKDIEYLGY